MKFIQAKSSEEIQKCFDIRIKVFVEEQKVPLDQEVDHYDHLESTKHFLLSDDQTPAGCFRLIDNGNSAKIGRVALLKQYRGKGYGDLIIQKALEEIIKVKNYKKAELGAQIRAKGFYQKYGFEETGEFYDDGGIPHTWMVKLL